MRDENRPAPNRTWAAIRGRLIDLNERAERLGVDPRRIGSPDGFTVERLRLGDWPREGDR